MWPFDDEDEDTTATRPAPAEPTPPGDDPSVGPAMSPEMRSQKVRDYITQKYKLASDDSDVRRASTEGDRTNTVANVAQALGGMANAWGGNRGDGGTGGVYDAIRGQAREKVKGAQSARDARMAGVDREYNLGRQTDADSRAGRDFANKQTEFGQQQTDYSADHDPNSERSKAARAFYRKSFPNMLGDVEGFDNLSAAEIKANLAEPIKMKEAIAARKEEAAQRSADRAAMLGARREDKADARTAKEVEYQAGIKVDDTEVKPGFRPTADAAKKAKDAKAIHDKITSALDEMDAIYKRSGTNLVGDDAARMNSLKTNVLMAQKEMDHLGVLSGQDEALTLEQIPDPTSLWENAKGMVGQDSYKAKIDQYRKNLDNQYDATLGASGYRRKGVRPDVFPGRKEGGTTSGATAVGSYKDLPE